MTDRLAYLTAKYKAGVELTPEESREVLALSPPLPPLLQKAVEEEVARYRFLLRETERGDDTE